MVAEILETVPRRNTTDLLFPSKVDSDRPLSGWSKYKTGLDEQYDVEPYVLHDLRRTFGTTLAELKVKPHLVERLLNHTMGSIGNKADSIVSAVAEVYSGVTSPQSPSITISQPTIFTLTCGAATAQTTIGLIPAFQEI